MSFLFTFDGRMKRLPYALASLAAFLGQHVFVLAVIGAHGAMPHLNWEFALIPLRTTLHYSYISSPIILAALTGMLFIVAGVALSALVFGAYGYGVFLVAPFVMGLTTAAIANRQHDIGRRTTWRLVLATLALGGAALVLTAIEGIGCVVMAAPLAALTAWLGGLSGRAMATQSQRPLQRTLQSVAVLPLVLIGETILAPAISFGTYNAVEIGASPAAVWDSLVDMQPLDEPVPVAFRLGLAYPLSGRIVGEGVGALRLGTFSTGTAIERITAWEPGSKLAFAVERDVPAMTELSPYEHVHAPHVLGYFTTGETSFELLPAEHSTQLILRSGHTLRLDPALYWLPLARWVVDRNNARVLAHIKRSAEAKAAAIAPGREDSLPAAPD